MQKLFILFLVMAMAVLAQGQGISTERMARANAYLGTPRILASKFTDTSKSVPPLYEAAVPDQYDAYRNWLYVTEDGQDAKGSLASPKRLHIGGRLAIDAVDNGTATDSILTIHNKVVQKAAVADLIGEYTVRVTTTGTDPVTVFRVPTFPGNKYQLEVSCNGILDKGKGSLEGKKRRGFLVDEGWSVIAGALTATEYIEYLGGLSSADYIITSQKSDLIVQAIGETNATINFEFKIKVYSIWANL